MSSDEIFNHRKNKFLRIGRTKGFISNLDDLSSLKPADNKLNQMCTLRLIGWQLSRQIILIQNQNSEMQIKFG